jgi:sigma-B regulation protein RsbU (phosphoserine phosphatase)
MTYGNLSFTLEPGDSIFLYTDGVTEAMDEELNEFTGKELLKTCTTLEKESVTQVVKGVLQQVRRHAGKTAQSDDIAMLMLRFHQPKKE